MNVLPILWVRGSIFRASVRTVPAVEEKPAERDPETGYITRQAVEARDAYDVVDFVIHTDEGGYANVSMRGDTLEAALGGQVPDKGTEVEWPVRCMTQWTGAPGRRYQIVGYYVAGEVLEAATAASSRGGARAAVAAV